MTHYYLKHIASGEFKHNNDLLVRGGESYKLLGFVVSSKSVLVRKVGEMGGFKEFPAHLFGCVIVKDGTGGKATK